MENMAHALYCQTRMAFTPNSFAFSAKINFAGYLNLEDIDIIQSITNQMNFTIFVYVPSAFSG